MNKVKSKISPADFKFAQADRAKTKSIIDLYEASTNYQKTLSNEKRKTLGIVYTPSWLAKHIVNNAVGQWSKFNNNKGEPQNAADLCSGTGIFIDELVNNFSNRKWSTEIFGYDIDEDAITLSKSIFKKAPHAKVKLQCQDSLFSNTNLFGEENKYDLIVGNPPYVSSSIIDSGPKKSLSNSFRTAQTGVFDLSIVFLEKIINSLNPGGVASIILSNKFMTSAYGKIITKILATECNILKIEDFNDMQVFDGFTTYTCVITFIKGKPSKRFVLRRYLDGVKGPIRNVPNFIEETVLHEQLLQHPWNFCLNIEDEIIKLCKMNSCKFNSIFPLVQQGVRTGANDIYVISNDDRHLFEQDILQPFVSGEDIKGLKITHVGEYAIYPYEESAGQIHSFSESDLKKKFPKTYKYLSSNRKRLEQRSLQGILNWYEYGRKQSLDVLRKKKILVKEMMPNAIFGVDLTGKYLFSSGYSLDATGLDDSHVNAWASILSTPVMEFLSRHVGTQLHSGWFRLMKHHLEALCLPIFSFSELDGISNTIKSESANNSAKVLNLIIAEKFGLTNDHLQYISVELAKCHSKSIPKKKTELELTKYEPVKLERFNKFHIQMDDLRQEVTFVPNKKIPVHNWYKYTQGFSANLVNKLLDEFGADSKSLVLDPFNGCGTTTTACAYRGIRSIGIEISPLMCLVADIKSTRWDITKIKVYLDNLNKKLRLHPAKVSRVRIFVDYFDKAYSTEILTQLDQISLLISQETDEQIKKFLSIGLLSIMEEVSKIRKHGSHYRYLNNTSSIGLQKLNIELINDSADIYVVFERRLKDMYQDICTSGGQPNGLTTVLLESALKTSIKNSSVDFIITSPPYLNRNNYVAQQKAELDILGLIQDKKTYNKLVKSTFRSHTDSKLDKSTLSDIDEVKLIVKNIDLEKGNNPKIPQMVCGYFDDLNRTLAELQRVLKVGGRMAFVVGNTRWGGVVVPIDHILAMLAERNGFKIDKILITRLKGNSPQQMKKYGRIAVRESIVLLTKK